MSPAFRPRVAAASLSGRSDATWARATTPHAGAAFLGGIAIDEPTRRAAREMVCRDREEFLPEDPVAFVDRQLGALEAEPLLAGFNVRTTSVEPLRAVARICRDRGAVLEVNAHCRQAEICDAGAGETLLADSERLRSYVRAAAAEGAPVSVKVRTEVGGVDLPTTARDVVEAGADAVHVDAMDSEPVVADVVDAVSAAGGATVIANNEVRDRASVREYLRHGADAVSVGRPSDDPTVMGRVREATTEWFAEEVRP
jgi:TIM-barrel protein